MSDARELALENKISRLEVANEDYRVWKAKWGERNNQLHNDLSAANKQIEQLQNSTEIENCPNCGGEIGYPQLTDGVHSEQSPWLECKKCSWTELDEAEQDNELPDVTAKYNELYERCYGIGGLAAQHNADFSEIKRLKAQLSDPALVKELVEAANVVINYPGLDEIAKLEDAVMQLDNFGINESIGKQTTTKSDKMPL